MQPKAEGLEGLRLCKRGACAARRGSKTRNPTHASGERRHGTTCLYGPEFLPIYIYLRSHITSNIPQQDMGNDLGLLIDTQYMHKDSCINR